MEKADGKTGIEIKDAPQGVRAYYEKGIAAMERDNLEYAMDMFEAALAIEPKLLSVRKLLRTAAAKNCRKNPPGKIAVAKSMSRLIKISALIRKNPAEALKQAEQVLRTDPLNPKFCKIQCDAAEAAGLPEAAVLTLETLNEHKPGNLAVLEQLARLYREMEQFDREYECRSEICKLKPTDAAAAKEMKDAAARLTMGKAGWQNAESFREIVRQEKSSEAKKISELEAAIAKVEAEPGNIKYRLALADIQLRGKQFDAAMETLKPIEGTDPQIERKLEQVEELQLSAKLADAEDRENSEQVQALRKELAQMRITNLSRQVERHPNDLQLKYDYGKLMLNSGAFTEAIQQFQQARRNPQRRIRSLIYLSRAFKAKEQFDIAIDQLDSALSELHTMDETKKEALYEKGLLHELLGQSDSAIRCFKEIYTVDIGYRDVADKVEG